MQVEKTSQSDMVDVTVVVPLLNEEANIEPLYRELSAVASSSDQRYEFIFIDDGSSDRTVELLYELAGNDVRVRVIEFTRKFGQTAALAAGFRMARGRIIIPMDGDLQNDPHDIPRLLAKLEEGRGYDIVSGWRQSRQDKWLSRRLPSVLANHLIRKLTWTPEIHDFGCTMKAYRREVLEDVNLYGEMHRFLPAVCKWRGARVTELPVNHRPRIAGVSKYGLKRTVKVLFDLITVKFIGDYLTKPIYFFGKLAIVGFVVSFLAVLTALLQKFNIFTEHGQPVMLNDNIFILFGMMTFLMTFMLMMLGVISELLVRIYHESQGRTPYKIKRFTQCSGEDVS